VLFSPQLLNMNVPGEKPSVEGIVKQLQKTAVEDDAGEAAQEAAVNDESNEKNQE